MTANSKSSTSIEVKRLTATEFDRWNACVAASDDATFFHKAEWYDVIVRAFRHTPYYLYTERNGAVSAILPLFHTKSMLFGNSLASVPFCVYGGAVGEHAEDRQALIEEACRIAAELKVDFLELRNRSEKEPGWPGKDLYVTFRREIDPDPDENLKKIPRKQRAMVRKGIKAGLVGREDQSVDDMYSCYAESVRNLGTPVFPKKYFQILKEVFADDCEVLTITHEGEPVAGVMSFYFKDEVLPYYGGGKFAARKLYANDFMYWQVMENAREKELKVFDYGRSKVDSGSYRFKKHWGFEPVPLAYSYHLVKADAVPNISPNNPKYKIFVDTWRKLPVGLANRVGPWLARQLG
ncbi:MAG: FemAB family XrtA/PEP-CTERM system-associated protein [Gammaproteobacteria bacterium]